MACRGVMKNVKHQPSCCACLWNGFLWGPVCVRVCVCVFIAALVGAISPARRHTRALAMAAHCWRVAASPTRTWNLSSFILQVSCSSLYDAFTLLVGHREGYPACKSCDEVLVWLSAWREVQIVCIWSSWCHCHPKTPSSLASFKSRLVLPLWCRLTQVFFWKRGC